MGIRIKTAAFTIGGLAALWLVNKVLNITVRTVDTLAEAGKWKAYYKYGEHEHAVPPGYARYGDWHSPEQQEQDLKEQMHQNKIDMKPIGESLEKIAKAYFKAKGIDSDGDKLNYDPVTYNDYYHSSDKKDSEENYNVPKELQDVFDQESPDEEEQDAECSEEDPDGKIIDIPVIRSDLDNK